MMADVIDFPRQDDSENPESNLPISSATDMELDAVIDQSLLSLPLEAAEQALVAKIIEAPSRDELQRQFDLFNMNQSKKNALRIIKLNNLLSKVEDQAIARFEKRPDQVSNKELLEYMNVVSNQIDRAQKQIESINMAPSVNIITQKNEVNVNLGGDELDRDSKERVMDAISALLNQVRSATSPVANPIDDEICDTLGDDLIIADVSDIEDVNTTGDDE